MSLTEIKALEEEIAALEETLRDKKNLLHRLKAKRPHCPYSYGLSSEEIVRYSRQMIMPQITKSGQVALKESKILIVGVGGLGCPASLYLAAAGVGEIHIVDYDDVELSNLHRQVLHCEADIGRTKTLSAFDKIRSINSDIAVRTFPIHADSSLIDIINMNHYDVVLDCSDNAPTRYLLNDICVLYNIPLVSGSALQMEGQLTVYNYKGSLCYRCLFPKPPPANTVTNCGDGGVLGPVAGVIGVLQALETIKILTKVEGVLSGRLLLFDGTNSTFRNVKLRQKVATCDVCGDNPKIESPIEDYEQFCGSEAHDKVVDIDILQNSDNVDVMQLNNILKENIVIDVRPVLEYEMCKLPNTVNLPFSLLTKNTGLNLLEEIVKKSSKKVTDVYFLCRRGNDSQRSVEYLRKSYPNTSLRFINVKGGLRAYSKKVDSSFPKY